ncbi:MAG: histidine phosphatase family protein, partial [Desulforhopalus sp.]
MDYNENNLAKDFTRQESSTLFGLLRHGQTEWNTQKRIQGSGDSPLTANGKEKTALWANFLKNDHWDRIIASDLGRVRATVDILNQKLQ